MPSHDERRREENRRGRGAPRDFTRRNELSEELLAILENADALALTRAQRPDDRRIAEHDLLEILTDEATGGWKLGAPGLPAAARIRQALEERERAGEVDENGAIVLAGVDQEVRAMIEVAHSLSQQRGLFPIRQRALLFALLCDEDGYAAHVFAKASRDPEVFRNFLAATLQDTDDDEPTPLKYGLSLEACARIVLPVLAEAKRLAGGHEVTQCELFRGFCAKCDPHFKATLRGLKKVGDLPDLKVDLDDLSRIDPDDPELTPGAQRIIETAHAMAQDLGVNPIPLRLLLAAFLRDPRNRTVRRFVQHHVPFDAAAKVLIQMVRPGVPVRFPLDHYARSRAVTPVLRRAVQLWREEGPIPEDVLFRAACACAGTEWKAMLLKELKLDLDAIAATELEPDAGEEPALDAFRARFDDGAWAVIEEAMRIARADGWAEVRSPHLFTALLASPGGPAARWIAGLGVDVDEARQIISAVVPPRPAAAAGPARPGWSKNLHAILARASDFAATAGRERAGEEDLLRAFQADANGVVPGLLRTLGVAITAPQTVQPQGRAVVKTIASPLAELGVDLTERARRGELPAIVGRDQEIESALATLVLTENANPLLIGDAGIGKTSIVEGIARRIFEGRCHPRLRDVRIIELTAGRLVADTKFRGQFEERMQRLLEEAERSGVVLFIDEIHTLTGTGASGASGPDAADLLKTALARGTLRLIGATTPAEFKKTIERDAALARRFQIQQISPPSREATLAVLASRQAGLEQHHGVSISEEARVAAVDLSGRYLLDKQWPAKARDLLDRACVQAATEAATPGGPPPPVTEMHVRRMVAQHTGLPVERLSAGDAQMLASLETQLEKRIVGQPQAIQRVAAAIRRGRQGLTSRARPWGVFLFVGPPGVGKTELAKVLAEEVFGGEGEPGDAEGLIRFDLGEFSEAHAVARLVGAPPGYAGYGQGSPLVERLRRRPYSVLLFDELEQAHEKVLAVFLRLVSEGTIVDLDGHPADARNCIVIFTSNLLGLDRPQRRIGFADLPTGDAAASDESQLRLLLGEKLPRQLIDRLDAIIPFHPLGEDSLTSIAAMLLRTVAIGVQAMHGINLRIDPEVARWLGRQAAARGSGARSIQRLVDQHVADPLTTTLARPEAHTRPVALMVRGEAVVVEVGGGSEPGTEAPQKFGVYQVLRRDDGRPFELGRGEMGVTYKALDAGLDRLVALKVISPQWMHDEGARQRFQREAQAAAHLRSERVASVYLFAQEKDVWYCAMEFIEGENLEHYVQQRGPFAATDALHIAAQTAEALGDAHGAGVLHRDVKPANLMVARPGAGPLDVTLIDFGLAKGLHARLPGEGTTTAGFVGSPAYASPEQCAQRELDGRSDIYSLGATLWFLLTGATPFSGGAAAVLTAHQHDPPPFARLKDTPMPVVTLLRRMLAKHPADRPQTPGELAIEIRRAIERLEAGAPSTPERLLAGRYELRGSSCEGASGAIHPAFDHQEGRLIAIKMLHQDFWPDDSLAPALTGELTKVFSFTHPNVLHHGWFEASSDSVFFTRDWIAGLSLGELLKRRRSFTAREVVVLLATLPDALDAALAAGLSVLELTPRKILLGTPGQDARESDWTRQPLESWPTLVLTLNPLCVELLRPQPADAMVDSQTSRTMVARVPVTPNTAARHFANLIAELLGRRRGAMDFTPLSALNESANQVLLKAASPRAFAKTAVFWDAFTRASCQG